MADVLAILNNSTANMSSCQSNNSNHIVANDAASNTGIKMINNNSNNSNNSNNIETMGHVGSIGTHSILPSPPLHLLHTQPISIPANNNYNNYNFNSVNNNLNNLNNNLHNNLHTGSRNDKLPSLNSILSKIQMEQKLPLPNPNFTLNLAAPKAYPIPHSSSPISSNSSVSSNNSNNSNISHISNISSKSSISSMSSISSNSSNFSPSLNDITQLRLIQHHHHHHHYFEENMNSSNPHTNTKFPAPVSILNPPVDTNNNTDVNTGSKEYPRSVIKSKPAKLPNSRTASPTNVVATSVRKYKCKVCEKAFTTSGHLARHNRIHTGVKNHICPFIGCDARFSRQDNCMQHFKTHLNGKKGRKKFKL